VITGKIAIRTRELIRIICQSNEVEILAGHVGNDHIHLLVSVPPHLSASKLVQYIKGNTSRKLQMEYKELNKQFWGQHLWTRGYFVASSGNVTDEIIKEYIKNQDLQERNGSVYFFDVGGQTATFICLYVKKTVHYFYYGSSSGSYL
jgi:putative transposase